MRTLARLLASTSLCFVLTFLLQYVEQMAENPVQPVILSLVLTSLATGFVARSASVAAAAAAVGGMASLTTAVLLGLLLWNPSPVPSDLLIIRLMILSGLVLLASGFGYVSGNLITTKPKEIARSREPSKPVQLEKKAEQSEPTQPVVTPPQEPGNKICKFCSSVIPNESVFCPMCGAKLIELGET